MAQTSLLKEIMNFMATSTTIKLKLTFFLSLVFLSCTAQDIEPTKLRTEVIIENKVFKVWYNEVFEQPMKLVYSSTNRPKGVDRGSMDFHTEKNIHTSDKNDYYRNIYDKGHLAPAATFSDVYENLYTTFSYLNCALQDQYLNRGEWRLLEEEERKWDDDENLTVTVELIFSDGHIVLPTGGHVPTRMVKHIFFTKTGLYKCFDFPNEKPSKGWETFQVTHKHD
jgi:endonuclease G, mitochondrial